MKRLTVLALVLSLAFSLVGCSEAEVPNTTVTTITTTATTEPKSTTQPTTTPTTAPQLITYPFNVKDEYLSYAVSVPQILYTTTGAENGLAGNIFVVEGTLEHIDTYTGEGNGFTYIFRDAFVNTNAGTVVISNIYESIYNASVTEYGETTTKSLFTDNVSDYIFPNEGETAKFICVYIGYSEFSKCPTFYLGASPNIYMIAELEDPVSGIIEDQNRSTDTDLTEDVGITATTGTEPPAQNETEETNLPTQSEPKQTTPPTQDEPEETEPPKQDQPEETTPPTQGGPSTGETNALNSAKDYLSLMPFSYNGLVDQLEYEGYTHTEATYAADNCGADWYAQALEEAKDYLSLMSFSYSGLIEQLEYEGYTNAEATYAADNCGADWYEQAVIAAKDYLDIMSFSRDGLIDQLEYVGFTHDQAVYGVEQNGL